MSATLSVNELPALFQAQLGPRFGLRLRLLVAIPRWLQVAGALNLAAYLLRRDARDLLNAALWMESVVQHIDAHHQGNYIDQEGHLATRLTTIESKIDALLEVLTQHFPKASNVKATLTMLFEAATEFRTQVRDLRSAVLCHDADVDAGKLADLRRAAVFNGAAHTDLTPLA